MTAATKSCPVCRSCGAKFPGRDSCKSCGANPNGAPVVSMRVNAAIPGKKPEDRKRRKALLRSLTQQPRRKKHGR